MFLHPLLAIHRTRSKQQTIVGDEREKRVAHVLLLGHLREGLLSFHHVLQCRLSPSGHCDNQTDNDHRNVFHKSVLRPSNPRPQWPLATRFQVSIDRSLSLRKAARGSLPPVDHTCQTAPANTNSPSTPPCSAPRRRQSFHKPAPCCQGRCHASARQAKARLHPGPAAARR